MLLSNFNFSLQEARKINVLYFLKHKQGALTRLNITFVLQFDSDGLWDVMSERRAIELVHEVMYIIS